MSKRSSTHALTLVETLAALVLLATLAGSAVVARHRLIAQRTRAAHIAEASTLAEQVLASWESGLEFAPATDAQEQTSLRWESSEETGPLPNTMIRELRVFHESDSEEPLFVVAFVLSADLPAQTAEQSP